jgi:hypothetical protein
MEIRDEHIEWAVVHRLSMLLEETHGEFNVTATYSAFVPILCWVMQRIRANDGTAAHRLLEELQQETAEDWQIQTRDDVAPLSEAAWKRVGPFPAFERRPADKVLIDLRNAVAHGDQRNVRPFHLAVKGTGRVELKGFTFRCQEKVDRKVVWQGEITLLESDMRYIGHRLAERYCAALGDADFRREASKGVVDSKHVARLGGQAG